MATRTVNKTEDGIFLDCCLTYSGTPIKTISGLSHLEGEIVNVLADGDIEIGLTVQNGSITLKNAASKIVAGLPYEFELETLRLEGDSTYGLTKSVNEINVFVDKSREDFFLVSSNGELCQNTRSIKSIDDVNYLYSGDISMQAFYDYSNEATVRIKQIYPFPLTINSVSLDVTVADSNA